MYRRGLRVIGIVATASAVALGTAGGASAAGVLRGAAARERALANVLADQGQSPVRTLDPDEAGEQAQYGFERTAPGTEVSGQALIDASAQAATLPTAGGAWQEFTTQSFNANPSDYTDPFWSNVGSGFSIVGGRTTALAATPDGTWFAGTADGGVWRSPDQGQHWTPVFDSMPSLAIGALAVDPHDGSLWVGTGEANTSQDSYAGTGVYETSNDGASFQRVGDTAGATNPLVSHTVYQIVFDQYGDAYAATDNGLWRYAVGTGQWTEVLDPSGPIDNPPYDNQVTSVQVVPGSGGQDVIAAIGWRGASDCCLENNGFYESTDGGDTFAPVTLSGDINSSDIGRTTFAYSADGSKLYAIVESPSMLAAGDETSLQGIFVSTGSPASVAGPWKLIANESILAASGSALPVGSGYGVGVQAWYNQDLAVDPSNPDHVYAGLEEVFESTDGGTTWNTASPYWNYGLACNSAPAGCPNTTHPDQHAMMISDGQIVIGNDGGVYSRPLSDNAQYGGWSDLNSTLHTWQYYAAAAGSVGLGRVGVWGGLQDNGTSLDQTGATQIVEPSGGDGFEVVVDPFNANRMVGEYADGAMYSSTDGGHSFYSYVTPGCDGQGTVLLPGGPLPGCDPSMRFLTPLISDATDIDTWVTGGEYVWVSHAGENTSCTQSGCTWQNVYDTGADNAVTALASTGAGKDIYAAYVSNLGEPGPTFGSGIATNYGGTWHDVTTANLPQRYVAGLAVDPLNPAHAYAVYNGYSRRWIPGGGVGHVFETDNGGKTWTDISTNLPDVASDALVIVKRQLVLATDLGMYTAPEYRGVFTRWSQLGTGLPNASVNDVTVGPGGYIYAATHGRGIWRLHVG